MFPDIGCLARYDLGVFVAAVVLARQFDNAGIDQLYNFYKDALLIERLIEPVKQLLDKFLLNKGIPEFPDGFAVRNLVAGFKFQKKPEAQPIGNLVLHLIFEKILQALENEDFEYHQPVERWSPHMLAVGCLVESKIENGHEGLPVDMCL